MPVSAPNKVSPAAALAVIYGTFGALWIVLSDATVGMLVRDPDMLTMIQTSKGWLFVALSAMLILVAGSRLMRALEASDQRYRLLFADNPQPMAIYDPATFRFIETNAAATRVLGYDRDEIAGMPVVDLMVAEDRPQVTALMEKARTSEERRETVWTARCKDGRQIQIEAQGASVLYDSRVVRLVVLTDMTARVQAEGALIRTLDRLARQESDRNQMTRALAHDTREPLRQVAGFVQLLDRRYRDRLDDDASQYIAYATEGIHRLNELLSDLQRFSDSRPAEYEDTAIGEVVAEVLAILAPRIDAVGATICVGAMPTIATDRRNLAVVFGCLVDNAIKFRRGGRQCHIELSADHLGLEWRFSLRDNGIGIEPEYHDAIFNLFGRLHTRDRIPGNGTGLALARKLVETLGGTIWVEDSAGEGAIFRFTLPAHPRRVADIDM